MCCASLASIMDKVNMGAFEEETMCHAIVMGVTVVGKVVSSNHQMTSSLHSHSPFPAASGFTQNATSQMTSAPKHSVSTSSSQLLRSC